MDTVASFLTHSVQACEPTAPVAATTTATGNLRNTRLPIDQSQSVSHVVSQNTLSHFCISLFADYHYPHLGVHIYLVTTVLQ